MQTKAALAAIHYRFIMDLDALPKHIYADVAYISFADVISLVPEELRATPGDWRTTTTWLSAVGINESLVKVLNKKTNSLKALVVRAPKKSVMIPFDELDRKLGKMSKDSTEAGLIDPHVRFCSRKDVEYCAPATPRALTRIDLDEVEGLLYDDEGLLYDDEVLTVDIYGESTWEGVRFCKNSVMNLLEPTNFADAESDYKEGEHYEMLECEDDCDHKFYTMYGLMCKIAWTKTHIGMELYKWVIDKVLHFADPAARVEYARQDVRRIRELFDLVDVALTGEAIICLGPASGVEDQTMVSRVAPETLVYRRITSTDLDDSKKGQLSDGRVVTFMTTTVTAAKKADDEFYAKLRNYDLLLTGNHFIALDEFVMKWDFIVSVERRDALDPMLSMLHEMEAELKKAEHAASALR